MTGIDFDKGMRRADSRYTEAERQGYHLWNTYNTKPEVEHAVKMLRHWGHKIKIIVYPSGVYAVLQKEGYKK